jgi:hypothetical protein
MEFQMNYVIEYLGLLDQATGGAFVDVKPDAQKRYNVVLNTLLQQTVQASGCKSWYHDAKARTSRSIPA